MKSMAHIHIFICLLMNLKCFAKTQALLQKDLNRFMLKHSIQYFVYTDMYNNVFFSKRATIKQMNFLLGCNAV
jgi:hypothetical protein